MPHRPGCGLAVWDEASALQGTTAALGDWLLLESLSIVPPIVHLRLSTTFNSQLRGA